MADMHDPKDVDPNSRSPPPKEKKKNIGVFFFFSLLTNSKVLQVLRFTVFLLEDVQSHRVIESRKGLPCRSRITNPLH